MGAAWTLKSRAKSDAIMDRSISLVIVACYSESWAVQAFDSTVSELVSERRVAEEQCGCISEGRLGGVGDDGHEADLSSAIGCVW